MKITKAELRRIIQEEAKSTKKYDNNPALKGDQDELPDHLQKGIIDKAKNEGDYLDEYSEMDELAETDELDEMYELDEM